MARRCVGLAALAALAGLIEACGGNAAQTCPRNGVVISSLRDVERNGEGLVSTTFGVAPARTADWSLATRVEGLLKLNWTAAKRSCPGLPAASITKLDTLITGLDQSLAAQDQQAAAYGANAVGLAVPDLFDYFHPASPKQIVDMDAVFRQLGLDAHFQMATAASADLALLKSDWDSAKAAVGARVPTCHRVAGTATVSSDIDQSLANGMAALATFDAATLEMESDAGALEIDTLELLFDCPPDGVVPSSGLGSPCATAATCDPGQVCAPFGTSGKRCSPSPDVARIGGPCSTTSDCGTDGRSACNTEPGDGYPGGYCFMEPCDDVQVCPPGATCVALGGETPGCFKACASDTDCRTGEGYVCQLFLTTPPKGFGPSDKACAFPCKRDTDCQTPLTCDVAMGKCKP